MRLREAAAAGYVRGDFILLSRITAQTGAGSFFGPRGGAVVGAAKVFARYRRDARSFMPGGRSNFQVKQMGAGDGFAYWVGIQRATARLQGMKKPIRMDLRITEIFQRVGKSWKLIHRHADPLVVSERR